MGMYNEVFDTCPECGKHTGYLQISQVVLGFGDFDLADLAWLKRRYDTGDLTADNLNRLADALEDFDSVFRCEANRGDEEVTCCGHSWRPDPAKILAIRMLTHVDTDATRHRALQMLEEAGIIPPQ